MARDWIDTRLETPGKIRAWAAWFGMRVLVLTPRVLLEIGYQTSRLAVQVFDMGRRSYDKALLYYDSIPLGRVPDGVLPSREQSDGFVEIEPITDVVEALEGKHGLIVGETGTGKSTLAQYLACTVGGRVTVYDADAAPDEWPGLEVVGRGGDFSAIASGMGFDLEDLQHQVELRGAKGDAALAGSARCLIAEEFPLLAEEVETATTWLKKHARRGRKPLRFVIALAQDDSVKALGIEGEGGVRKNFRMVRLGKTAVSHAKSLKDDRLVGWLRSDRSHCLVDDQPCKLPSYRELKAVTNRLGNSVVQTVETTAEREITEFPTDAEVTLWKAISAVLDSGRGESYVVKEILGYQGSQYQQGKAVLADLKSKFG
jgi:energy-coupling factor transporter ATP-binding protein EcfA2